MSKSGQQLNPAIRSWVDNCLVTILVRDFLAEREREESACSKPKPVKHSAPIPVSAEEGK